MKNESFSKVDEAVRIPRSDINSHMKFEQLIL